MWNSRCTISILSMSMVDAFKSWEHHFPPSDDDAERDIQSRMKNFVALVIDDEIKRKEGHRKEIVPQPDGYVLELIGKPVIQGGKLKGKLITRQKRCVVCSKEVKVFETSRTKQRG